MVVSPPNRSTEDRVAARSFSFRRPPMGCARGPREAQRGAAGGPCKALQLEQRSDSFVTPGRLWPGRRQGPMTTNPRRCRHYVEVGGPGQPPDRNVIVILAHYGGRRHPLLLGHKPIWFGGPWPRREAPEAYLTTVSVVSSSARSSEPGSISVRASPDVDGTQPPVSRSGRIRARRRGRRRTRFRTSNWHEFASSVP
jgi:hypothetical protein